MTADQKEKVFAWLSGNGYPPVQVARNDKGELVTYELEWDFEYGDPGEDMVVGLNVFDGEIVYVDDRTSQDIRGHYGIPDGFIVGEWWYGNWRQATAAEAAELGVIAGITYLCRQCGAAEQT